MTHIIKGRGKLRTTYTDDSTPAGLWLKVFVAPKWERDLPVEHPNDLAKVTTYEPWSYRSEMGPSEDCIN